MKLFKNKAFLLVTLVMFATGSIYGALTTDWYRVFVRGEVLNYPVKASTTIYRGSAVGLEASGDGFQYARPYTVTDAFVGFSERRANNSSGAAGAISVNVVRRGLIWLNVTNSTSDTQTATGQILTAADDNTFTFFKDDSTGDASSDFAIGRIVDVVDGTDRVLVEFNAFYNIDRNAAKR